AYGDAPVRGSPVAPAVLRRELASNRRYAGRRARRQSFGRRARETRPTVVRCGARCLDEAICADAPVAVPTTDQRRAGALPDARREARQHQAEHALEQRRIGADVVCGGGVDRTATAEENRA